MPKDQVAGSVIERGATVVITHRVAPARHADYERWLADMVPQVRSAAGLLDWQMIRPIPELTATYTVILRFESVPLLQAWMHSEVRARLIERVRPLLLHDDRYRISSGLDFLFASEPGKPKVPVRWKQWLITWSAIFPLVLLIPLAVLPVLHRMGVPVWRPLDTLIVSGIAVSLMVYVVMPRYTRAVQHWLYR